MYQNNVTILYLLHMLGESIVSIFVLFHSNEDVNVVEYCSNVLQEKK